eukprot:gene26538-biopygen16801
MMRWWRGTVVGGGGWLSTIEISELRGSSPLGEGDLDDVYVRVARSEGFMGFDSWHVQSDSWHVQSDSWASR